MVIDIEPEEVDQTELTDEQEQFLQKVIDNFPASQENKIGMTHLLRHKIDTKDQFLQRYSKKWTKKSTEWFHWVSSKNPKVPVPIR
jgi:hypothetical protein